jgi:cytochrome c oxidase subunit 3
MSTPSFSETIDHFSPAQEEGTGVPGAEKGLHGRPAPPSIQDQRYKTGTMVGLAGILMFFTAFVSAYIVRQGLGTDWEPIKLPNLVWYNTLILLASSFSLEMARTRLKDLPALRSWWLGTATLGTVFLVGQLVVWQKLSAEGVYLASNPSSSFFYVLTAVHGIHLLGGVLALLILSLKLWGGILASHHVGSMALYWHFMDFLWILLLLLFVFWR